MKPSCWLWNGISVINSFTKLSTNCNSLSLLMQFRRSEAPPVLINANPLFITWNSIRREFVGDLSASWGSGEITTSAGPGDVDKKVS